MNNHTVLVVTTISEPNEALRKLSNGCRENNIHFIIIGDTKSPPDFVLAYGDYYSIERQLETGFQYVKLCPTKHYARKNIGYLIAMKKGCENILETDDDNFPYDDFWKERFRLQKAPTISEFGWLNIYKYFVKDSSNIWPRGLPLNAVLKKAPELTTVNAEEVDCPIQQGMADQNPDVDAIYRLTMSLPLEVKREGAIILKDRTWCPFNSQNTTWWKDAFPLLYLPAHCSFRMTDIWRSFVGQRIAWENDWGILFHGATVWQERNEHDLMRDFKDEISGYINNEDIGKRLESIRLKRGNRHIFDNLRKCYDELYKNKYILEKELPLLEAWINDIKSLWQ